MSHLRSLHWTVALPVLGAITLIAAWGSKPATPALVLIGALLAGAVMSAVHHAEVVAHRVGEPFGSLVLAVAVTVIEVALIVTLMLSGGPETASIGLTIPAIAVASIWLDGPLVLGLDTTQIVLLVITMIVGALTVLPGRATVQEGGLHLVLFAAFVFLAVNP